MLICSISILFLKHIFSLILSISLSKNLLHNSLEESMKKIQYREYDHWIINFALNLDDIRNSNLH